MLSYSSRLYKKSPVWLQEAIIFFRFFVRKCLREGRTFKKIHGRIERTQWMTRDELQNYQDGQLYSILQHARSKIPFYQQQAEKDVDAEMGVRDIVRQFPVLQKQTVVEHREMFVNPKHFGLKFKSATSGTTGLSMVGFRDLYSISFENAFLTRQLEWAGYQKGEKRAWIRGDMIVPPGTKKPPYWRVNRADNMLMLSAYHLSPTTVALYIQELEKFDPVLIQAYPSAIAYMAEQLLSQGQLYRGTKLKGIVTSSESLSAAQRSSIETAMGVRVFDWYGSFERCVAIGTCEHGAYHLLTDYSFVECIPVDDTACELIGTGFGNFLMPLIRYRIGDSIVLADEEYQCPCGRAFPVVQEIIGRVDDVVKTPDGKRIGMAINIFDGINNIIESQLVQDRIDEITLYLVVTPQFTETDKNALLKRAGNIIGTDIAFTIKTVERLNRTKNGKLRTIICNV